MKNNAIYFGMRLDEDDGERQNIVDKTFWGTHGNDSSNKISYSLFFHTKQQSKPVKNEYLIM